MDPRRVRTDQGWKITAAVAVAALLLTGAGAAQAQGTAITDMTVRRAELTEFASLPETAIEALRFSPNAAVLACGTATGHVVLFDVATRAVLREMRSDGAAVTGLSFSPDGTLLASSDASGGIQVWNPTTGELVWSFVDSGAVHDVEFTPQGSFLVVVGESRVVRIWETVTWKPRPSITGHTAPIYAFAVSPEEDLIVTGAGNDDPTIRLWSFPAGEPLGEDLYEGRVHDIEYSPRDRQVAVSGSQPTVWLWEVDRLDFLHMIFGGRAAVTDVVYSSRGTALVTVSEDGVFQYHRVPDVFEQRTIRFERPLSAVDYSADRLLIVCGDRAGTVFLLSVP